VSLGNLAEITCHCLNESKARSFSPTIHEKVRVYSCDRMLARSFRYCEGKHTSLIFMYEYDSYNTKHCVNISFVGLRMVCTSHGHLFSTFGRKGCRGRGAEWERNGRTTIPHRSFEALGSHMEKLRKYCVMLSVIDT
jgi:hypothetical protein